MATTAEARARELPLLMRATEALLLAAYDGHAVLDVALELLREYFGYGSTYLLLYDRSSSELALAHAAGVGADRADVRDFRTKLGVGLTGIAGQTKQIVNVGDVRADPRYLDVVPGCVSEICVPLVVGGELFGVLAVESPLRDAFSSRDADLLTAFAHVTALAILLARANADARRLAITDDLTGLYNSRHFQQRLEEEVTRARRYGRDLALLIIDSDALKRVNDTLGHAAGNDLLVAIARAIRQNVRSTDIVARFGGDEFVVLQPETALEAALVTAERIRRAAHVAAYAAGTERSVSIGVATFPTSADTPDGLFQRADAALYDAKRQGKNRVEVALT